MNVVERNNVRVLGKGSKLMMMAHGYGCSQQMWRLITPAFLEEYQIVLFDLVGSGHSDTSAYDRVKYATLAGYSSDVLEICRALDLKDVIYVGHSVSAMIGVLAAIEAPDLFKRLVLIGPSPCYLNDGDYVGGFDRETLNGLLKSIEADHRSWSESLAPVIMGNLERPELAAELVESFCHTKPDIAKHFARVVFLSDNRQDLSKLKTPSLILQCSNDAIAPETVGRYLERHLRGSTLKLMKATGHCPHLSHPAETIALMQEYLKAT